MSGSKQKLPSSVFSEVQQKCRMQSKYKNQKKKKCKFFIEWKLHKITSACNLIALFAIKFSYTKRLKQSIVPCSTLYTLMACRGVAWALFKNNNNKNRKNIFMCVCMYHIYTYIYLYDCNISLLNQFGRLHGYGYSYLRCMWVLDRINWVLVAYNTIF